MYSQIIVDNNRKRVARRVTCPRYHCANGIQKYLKTKYNIWLTEDVYWDILSKFFKYASPNEEFKFKKKLKDIATLERYVQNRFPKFGHYIKRYYLPEYNKQTEVEETVVEEVQQEEVEKTRNNSKPQLGIGWRILGRIVRAIS